MSWSIGAQNCSSIAGITHDGSISLFPTTDYDAGCGWNGNVGVVVNGQLMVTMGAVVIATKITGK